MKSKMNRARLDELSQQIQLAFVNGHTRAQAAQKLKVSQQTMGRYVRAPHTMTASQFFTLLDHLEIKH